MKKAFKHIKWLLVNFGPVIIFLSVKHVAGLKPAIIASVIWSVAELIFLVAYKREKPTPFFYFVTSTTLIFGCIDLYSENPFLFRYESVISNILTGLYFGATLFLGKPLIHELAEKAKSEDISSPNAGLYLRFLTAVWTFYFFLKATLYFYIAQTSLSIEQTTLIRSALGPISFAIMIGGEKLLRPITTRALKSLGWLSASETPPQASE